MRLLAILYALLVPVLSIAQPVYTIDQSVPMIKDGQILSLSWVGGLNSSQYNTMDLNDDGKEDLVVYDRTANRVYPFVAEASGHVYKPEYTFDFPDEIRHWMLLRDFNCDGKKDIFTSHNFGIRVFINEGIDNGKLKWTPYITGQDNAGNDQFFLKTKGFSSIINMQMNSSDIPAILDMDGDSDLDILMFTASGISSVEYHKNLSVENGSGCNALVFERITQRWGEFQECDCGVYAFEGKNCTETGGREQHQGGKSLLVLDVDGDGDKDVLASEESCSSLVLLENTGTDASPIFTSLSINYPLGTQAAHMLYFPTAYYEDVDHDGNKDLLVSPNISSNPTGLVNFQQSNWWYQNDGSTGNPVLNFVQRDFLQDKMIDLGENLVPAFADYDNDGDLDLFVSGFVDLEASGYNSRIFLYRNTGTSTNPEYTLENDDYMSFSQRNYFSVKPKFKDINGDGRPDFVFSATLHSGLATTAIYYILNKADGAFSFDNDIRILFDEMGYEENFEIYDIDGDGLQDVIMGKHDGRLIYYRNVGSATSPAYAVEDETFYGFGLSTSRLDVSAAIGDLDMDGKVDMIVGDRRGSFVIYENILETMDNPQEGRTDLFLDERTGAVTNFRLGSKLSPVMVNLFDENKPSIAVGTGQGGLVLLRAAGADQGSGSNGDLSIYPNPIRKAQRDYFTAQSKVSGYATIVNALGQQITEPFYMSASMPMSFNTANLRPGMYVLIMNTGKEDYIQRKFLIVN